MLSGPGVEITYAATADPLSELAEALVALTFTL
jgi:hypothetical protein